MISKKRVRPKLNPYLISTSFEGTGGIIIDTRGLSYLVLNKTAWFVWEMLRQRESPGSIVRTVAFRYGVSKDIAKKTVDQVLEVLKRRRYLAA
jgi:hypothetical protein